MTLAAAVRVLASLLFSALILAGVNLMLVAGTLSPAWTAPAMSVAADRLELSEGVGESGEGQLRLLGLSRAGAARIQLPTGAVHAADYGFVQVLLSESANPYSRVDLVWRTAAQPERSNRLRMQVWGDGLFAKLLVDPGWKGEITEMAVVIADPRALPLGIRGVVLEPISAEAYFAAIWRDWTEHEGFRGDSQHFVTGSVTDPLLPLRPTVVVWTGLALVILSLGWASGADSRAAPEILLVILAGWLVVDARWQLDLAFQWRRDRDQFAGLTQEQKHVRFDGDRLLRLVDWVRSRYQPEQQRIFIHVGDGVSAAGTKRKRLSYHLYPFNVNGVSRSLPRGDLLRPGDLIVLIGDREERGEGRRLRLPGRNRLVEVYADADHRVFRVIADAGAGPA